jgi:hypothetical protein
MVKKYKGAESLIEPPPEGWGMIWFADGYQAQVGGAKVVLKEGKEYVRFYLMPYQATAKRFNIDLKKGLDRNGYCYKWYPKEMVYSLNTYDPARRVFFCMLNWDGKDTESTKWFKGEEQANRIEKMKNTMRGIKAHNERLREENFVLRTNVEKYIKDNLSGIIKPMLPALRSLITPELKEGGTPHVA